MGKKITLVVEIDTETYASKMDGPVKSPPAMAWLLLEAERLWMRELNRRQDAAGERRIHVPDLHVDL